MKKIYTLFLIFTTSLAFGQIEGTWQLAKQPAALAVGPNQGDGSWWSSSIGDTLTRNCLWDDSINFNAGVMTHYMDGSTWNETWQGAAQEQCGTPVAPHDGTTNAPFSYNYNSGTGLLTVYGIGAHIGLPKAINGSEITSPANAADSIIYMLTFSNNNNTFTADINIGAGWWRFIYTKVGAPPAALPNVTFQVDMSEYTGSLANGVFVNGDFNGWCGSCNPMNDIGNGIWEVTVPLPAGNIQYKFTVDGWTDQEIFDSTATCIDPIDDGFYNRYLTISGDTTLPANCFSSCEACATAGINDLDIEELILSPNPASTYIEIITNEAIEEIEIIDLKGKILKSSVKEKLINIENLPAGIYQARISTEQKVTVKRFIKK